MSTADILTDNSADNSVIEDKFHNVSLEDLADDYGQLDAQIKELETRQKEISKSIKLRAANKQKIVGSKFTVTKSVSKDSIRPDIEAIEHHFGGTIPPHLNKIQKGSTRLTVGTVAVWDAM
jgi:hypothetical protein